MFLKHHEITSGTCLILMSAETIENTPLSPLGMKEYLKLKLKHLIKMERTTLNFATSQTTGITQMLLQSEYFLMNGLY